MMFLLSAERGPKRRCNLDGNRRKCAILVYLIFDLKALFGYSKNTYQTEAPFLLTIELFAGAAMLVRSSPTKSRKRMVRDVFDAFAIHSDIVHDVTDTDLLSTKWLHSRSCFGDFQTSFFLSFLFK